MMRFLLIILSAAILLPTAKLSHASEDNKDSQSAAGFDKSNFIDASIFAQPQYMISPIISPDGQNVAFQEQIGENRFLTIVHTKTKKVDRIQTPEIAWFTWAGNSRLLTRITGVKTRSNYYVLELSDLSFKGVGNDGYSPSGSQIIYIHPSGEYFLQSKQREPFETPSVFRVDIKDNIVTKIVKPQHNIWNWYADNEGIVRVGMKYVNNKIKVYYRRTNQDAFSLTNKINTKDPKSKDRQDLFAFNDIVAGSDDGYVMSNQGTGRFALYHYNYLTGETGDMVFGHDSNDINNYSLSLDGKTLRSVTYTEDRDRIKWFDPEINKMQAQLEKALPGQEIWLRSRSNDGNNIVIYTLSSTDPGSFYLFKKKEKKLERLGGVNDSINPDQMSETQYINYTARDGLKIHGYLTLPKGRDPKNLPLIILPHGGPYGVRDNGDYDAEVQFLANRGYVILQPNFRGSESYGVSYFEKGKGEIGRNMQDDLDDGMDWLVKQGIVDAGRVCLVGSSYGGYASLWGVIRNPERYRCAVSFAGVTEFNSQLKYSKQFFRSRYAREWKTTVRGDKEFNLDSVSPVHQIARLTRPVLLTHGDEDTIVPFSQYKKMVKAGKKAGIPIETHVYKGEGHGFKETDNEIDWYKRLETFLDKHNPA